MSEFQITLIRPKDYLHTECFREVAETLQFGLCDIGHTAHIRENIFDAGATNLILGAHLLSSEQVSTIPSGSIIYNLEQLGGPSLPQQFYELATRHQIWDYNLANVEKWKARSCAQPPRHVLLGYVSELTRIASSEPQEQDIDVLFYGSVNPRRMHILSLLEAAGVRVHAAYGIYGEDRDKLIARSKVILNVHYYDTKLLEVVRLSYLLANAKAIVTECWADSGMEQLPADAVLSVSYESLVEGCLSLLRNERERRELETRGFNHFSQIKECDILKQALAQPAIQGVNTGCLVVPRKLNLGSGKDWRADCLNVDINPYWQPDAILDFSQPLPAGCPLETSRFGSVMLQNGYFDEVIANDCLEHVASLTTAMTSCLNLLRVDGLFRISVPYDLSWGAWQDPTHVRAFNERSWLYFTDWFWYLGWEEARFEIADLKVTLSPVGDELNRQQVKNEDLVRQPRAVDSMQVVLRKRLLTEPEKQQAGAYLKRPGRNQGYAAPTFDQRATAGTGVPQTSSTTARPALSNNLEEPVPALNALQTLYLDLVQKCVINLIYEDPNYGPWAPSVYNSQLRELGRDWPSMAHSMIGSRRMSNLRQLAEFVITNRIPGDFIEAGVWRGGACIMMRAVLKAYGVTNRRVWVADSFCGLPEPDAKYPDDRGDKHHTFKELAVSLPEVQANFAKYDLLDDQVQFLEGWFSKTLPIAPIERLAILRLDGDMYESTLDGLLNLYDRVSEGGFIIVDDYGAINGCQKAVLKFRDDRGIEAPLHNIDDIGMFWQKPGGRAY